MPNMEVLMDADGCLEDTPEPKIVRVRNVRMMARMPRAMESGKSAVLIVIDLPDGRVVAAETSLAIMDTAVHAFRGAEQRDLDLAEAAAKGPRS